MTREEFLARCAAVENLAACAAVEHLAEVRALMQEVGESDPVWLTSVDAEVAWHCLRLQMLLYSRQQGLLAEVDVKQARVGQQLDQVEQLLDEVRQEKADAQAMRDAAQGATDDLDLFQAGYERGYAQGWQHRGEQGKEDSA